MEFKMEYHFTNQYYAAISPVLNGIILQNRLLWLQNYRLRQQNKVFRQRIQLLKKQNAPLARHIRYIVQKNEGEYTVPKRGYRTQKKIRKNKKQYPAQLSFVSSHPQFFYCESPQFQQSLILQNSEVECENRFLKIQGQELRQDLEECIEENNRLKKYNNQHLNRSQEEDDYKIFKRTYRPRKQNLIKNIQCTQPGCERKYSSQTALRNHERQYHGMRSKLVRSNEEVKSSCDST